MKGQNKKYTFKKGIVTNNKKALVSLGLAILMLCSGCASEVENLEGIDTDYTQTEPAAQTVYTEESTVETDNTSATGITTDSAEKTVSEESTTASTVSAVESATAPVTITTNPPAKHTTTVANTPKTTTSAATTAATTAVTTVTTTTVPTTKDEDDPGKLEYNDKLTTAQIVKNMGLGINLGNTFEACGDWIDESWGQQAFETAWGSPVITKEIIEGYAKSGFGVLRIPVAWSNLMSDDYTISKALMDRVKQVAKWTVDSGMYAIVNIHWDGGWWTKFPDEKEECMKKYTRIWEQICEGFKDFDGRVVFESLNEEGGSWESLWNRYTGVGDKKASYDLLNEINQKFVNIVRSSGGKNENRHLLIAGFCTDIGQTCDQLYKMPNDPKKRCAVSVHYYTPATFCLLTEDVDWGKLQTTWGTKAEVNELVNNMQKMKEHFVDKGVPVIIGEFSVCEKKIKELESVHRFIAAVVKEATERGMCPVLWDITDDYYNRKTCQFIDQDLLQKMKNANANK